MDEIAAIRTFMRVVESGSFSAVSRQANIGQPAVSEQRIWMLSFYGEPRAI
jgi:DNA-binding transcriptional LysR family regulator